MNIFRKHYNNAIEYGVSLSRKKRILKLLGDVQNKQVLDIGCASGYLGAELKKCGAREVAGIDISENQIEKAKRVLDKVFVLDIQEEKIPFGDNYFDIVIFAEVIEHLLRPEKAMQEIKRVLKKNGAVIVSTPNFLVFTNRIKMLFGKFEYTETGFLDRGHIHFFTHKSLSDFVKENGFLTEKENNILHPKTPNFLGKIFPNLFVFQSIIKIKKCEDSNC